MTWAELKSRSGAMDRMAMANTKAGLAAAQFLLQKKAARRKAIAI